MEDNPRPAIPRTTMERLPGYLNFLRMKTGPEYERISSTVIAQEMNLSAITVRKDLACIANGRPRIGHKREELITRIAEVLGSSECNSAVLVGVGNLGHALLCYKGFANYGMRILAGFDVSGHLIGSEINGKTIYHINNLYSFVKRTGASIGIIAVPAPSAQEVCDRMVAAGIRGILNFAPAHLRAPNNVVVRHEDFAVSGSHCSPSQPNARSTPRRFPRDLISKSKWTATPYRVALLVFKSVLRLQNRHSNFAH